MDLASFGPLVGSLLQAGAPMISTALQMGIGEIPIIGGIAGPLVGMAAPNIVSLIAQRLGAPADATPAQLSAKIDADPNGAKAALASLEEEHSFDLASQAQQVGTNTTEAQSGSLFVAGWRPMIGWSLGGLVMLSFTLPYLVWGIAVAGWTLPAPPPLDPQAIAILSALLGISVLARSVDKARGTATTVITPARKAR